MFEGWWIAGALRELQSGERAAIYQTEADQGIVGFFDFSLVPFDHPDFGWAGYGMPIELPTPISRKRLLGDTDLEPVFRHIQHKRYLDEPAQRHALANLIGDLPKFARIADPLPGTDEDWEWEGSAKGGWVLEHAMRDAIIDRRGAWERELRFPQQPLAEQRPPGSQRRVDLWAPGVIGECKLMAGRAAVDQLRDYLKLYEDGEGGQWLGHLIAAHGYTAQVADEVENDDRIRLWTCARGRGGRPRLKQIA